MLSVLVSGEGSRAGGTKTRRVNSRTFEGTAEEDLLRNKKRQKKSREPSIERFPREREANGKITEDGHSHRGREGKGKEGLKRRRKKKKP